MKYATARPYAGPEKAARRILEIANAVEPIQGRIHIEKINEPFLFRDRGSRVRLRPQTRDRVRLAQDARIRDVCDLHAGRRGTVRVRRNGQLFRNVGNQTLDNWLPRTIF
jgi:hypothetical protein